jgi:hypothetical protein
MTSDGDTNYAAGFRITSGAVRVGDFIRFGGHGVNRADVWWKVLSRAGAVVELINAAGQRRTRAMQNWDKIYRHAYSQKHSA